MAEVKKTEFLVLGPLEIVAGGRVLQVSAPRQRALLASLVLRANQLVPVERLVGELWGDDPPDKARVALRMAVVRLRRLLAASDPDGGQGAQLVTRAGGYLLQIEPDQVDAFRFERMATEGRAALAAGDAEEAARRLGAALALWRGRRLPACSPPRWWRPRRSGWSCCGSTRWRTAWTPSWCAAATSRCSPSWRRWWVSIRCGSGCGGS